MPNDSSIRPAPPPGAVHRPREGGDFIAGMLLVAFIAAPLVAWWVLVQMRRTPPTGAQPAAALAGSSAEPRLLLPETAERAPAAVAPDPDGTLPVAFVDLGFAPPNEGRLYQPAGAPPQFLEFAPASIRELDGRVVRITGFMIPLRMEGGRLRECAIVASRFNCCFGVPPRFCEFVIARLPPDGPAPQADIPLSFKGTLHVGDVIEDGLWSTFYVLDCLSVTL